MYQLQYHELNDCFRYQLIVLVHILEQVSEVEIEDIAIAFEKFWLSSPNGHVFDENNDYRGFNCYDERDIYQLFGLELIRGLSDEEMTDWF